MSDYEFMEDREDVSSEIRYLTLELMKLAARQNKSFKEIVNEFIDNAYFLQTTLESLENNEESYEKCYEKRKNDSMEISNSRSDSKRSKLKIVKK